MSGGRKKSECFDWSEAAKEKLRALWMQADPVLSAARIAVELRTTKHSVVGMVHRMGLPERPSPIVRRAEAADVPTPSRWEQERELAGAEPLAAFHPIAREVLADAARLVLGLALVVALGAGRPTSAHAAPPPGVGDAAASAWFRGLLNAQGRNCCSEADCRRTAVRPAAGGGLEAWVGREEFGPGAPDEWMPIPAEEVRSRGNRPPGVRGAIACFYERRVFCADLEDGS